MLEQIYGNYNFKLFNDFLKQLNFEIKENTIEIKRKNYSHWVIVSARLKNNLDLKISHFEDSEEIWITFGFYNEGINLEQIEFIFQKDTNRFENNFIIHDYFIQDNDIAITFNSAYNFHNDNFIVGTEQIRRVYFNDIVDYAGRDNLANLAINIDHSKNTKVLYKQDNLNVDLEPNIETISLKNKQQVINVLVKK